MTASAHGDRGHQRSADGCPAVVVEHVSLDREFLARLVGTDQRRAPRRPIARTVLRGPQPSACSSQMLMPGILDSLRPRNRLRRGWSRWGRRRSPSRHRHSDRLPRVECAVLSHAALHTRARGTRSVPGRCTEAGCAARSASSRRARLDPTSDSACSGTRPSLPNGIFSAQTETSGAIFLKSRLASGSFGVTRLGARPRRSH